MPLLSTLGERIATAFARGASLMVQPRRNLRACSPMTIRSLKRGCLMRSLRKSRCGRRAIIHGSKKSGFLVVTTHVSFTAMLSRQSCRRSKAMLWHGCLRIGSGKNVIGRGSFSSFKITDQAGILRFTSSVAATAGLLSMPWISRKRSGEVNGANTTRSRLCPFAPLR